MKVAAIVAGVVTVLKQLDLIQAAPPPEGAFSGQHSPSLRSHIMYERIQKAATVTTLALLEIALAVVVAVRPRVSADLHLAVDALAVVVALALVVLGIESLRN